MIQAQTILAEPDIERIGVATSFGLGANSLPRQTGSLRECFGYFGKDAHHSVQWSRQALWCTLVGHNPQSSRPTLIWAKIFLFSPKVPGRGHFKKCTISPKLFVAVIIRENSPR